MRAIMIAGVCLLASSLVPLVSCQTDGYHTPDRRCDIEFVEDETNVCVPQLVTKCNDEYLTVFKPKKEKKCITVKATRCEPGVESRDVEMCTIDYEYSELRAKASRVEVDYSKSCNTEYVRECETGRDADEDEDCREVPRERCENVPQARNEKNDITLTVPKPVKNCETRTLNLPSVTCTEESEERCFEVVTIEEATEVVEMCETELDGEKCEDVNLNLPAQKCEERARKANVVARAAPARATVLRTIDQPRLVQTISEPAVVRTVDQATLVGTFSQTQ